MTQVLTSLSGVGAPVSGARWWSTALVPNSGNWNFITQAYNLGSHLQPEWVVVNIFSGTTSLTSGTRDAPSSTNFNATSFNYPVDNNQLLCSNGRVIFPCKYTQIAYYDPSDRLVHELPKLNDPINDISPAPSGNDILFSAMFDSTGTLYFGTQARDGFRPAIFKFHTGTLSGTNLGHVGNSGGIRYAYRLAPDPPYIYVAAGQDPWELCSIHTGTLSSSVIARPYTGMEFNAKAEGWTVKLISGSNVTNWWIVDGTLYAFTASYNPLTLPFPPRNVTSSAPYQTIGAPQIDYTLGIGKLLWRPTGSSSPWTQINYSVQHTATISIESMYMLPDESLFGNSVQYGGFFRRTAGGVLTYYGAWGGVSQPVYCTSGTDVFFSGYPNGVLYRYDHTASWENLVNPALIGYFHDTSMIKYSYFIRTSETNGRIYSCGRVERDGQGTGLGWYQPGTGTFGGHHDFPLNFYNPRGFLVMDSLGLVVFSGDVISDASFPGQTPSSASLFVYDLNLASGTQKTIVSGASDTGVLFKTQTDGMIIGVMSSPKIIYRYDVGNGVVAATSSYGGTLGAITQRPSDKSVWVVLDGAIRRIDPLSLQMSSYLDVSSL